MRGDLWYTLAFQQDHVVASVGEVLAEGVEALGPGSEAGRRLDECREYLRFVEAELEPLMRRWQAHRAKWLAQRRPV
ncbi:hypothetical protein [Lentzea guizhouensis]|uniref:hypothetical protein n=1 Tax=Lentzea guizhouensis TaxID=1586287 RepID=UPI001F414CE8|nr:hypothetical protein [Lentzea guizhouensis]